MSWQQDLGKLGVDTTFEFGHCRSSRGLLPIWAQLACHGSGRDKLTYQRLFVLWAVSFVCLHLPGTYMRLMSLPKRHMLARISVADVLNRQARRPRAETVITLVLLIPPALALLHAA